jgi:hypothetical protein
MNINLDKIFQSKLFRGIILGLLALLVVLLILKIGMFIGIKKADFSHRWSDNYHQNFGGPRNGFMEGIRDQDFMEANGIFGQIIKINLSTDQKQLTTIVVKGRDNVEKIIAVNDKTIIKRFMGDVKINDLKVDEYIVVIGDPNESGQIVAKLIRVMPQQPSMMLPPNSVNPN